jgi:threonine synthase
MKSDEKIVILNTGAGIKYPDTAQVNPPILNIEDLLPSLEDQ